MSILFHVPDSSTTETFEDYNLGELDGQGNWVEHPSTPSTDIFMVTDSIAQTGSKCVYVNYDAASTIENVFSAEPGIVDITFYVRSDNVAGNTARFGLANGDGVDGGKQAAHIRINGSDFQNYNGSTWANITNSNVLSNDTWHKIRIVANSISNNFEFYLDNLKRGTTHDFRANQASLDRFYLNCSGGAGGADIWVDSIDLILGV